MLTSAHLNKKRDNKAPVIQSVTASTRVILNIKKSEESTVSANKRMNKLNQKKFDLATKSLTNVKLLSPSANEESTRGGSGIPDDEQRSQLSTINQSVTP